MLHSDKRGILSHDAEYEALVQTSRARIDLPVPRVQQAPCARCHQLSAL